jgi:hypothetical protein
LWHEPTRYVIENGVCISREIHKQFHREYGSGNNTSSQFEDFCRKHYNITSFPWQNHKPLLTLEQEWDVLAKISQQKATEFEARVTRHGHVISEGQYINNNSELVITCPKHNESYLLSAKKYKHNAKGLYCCGKQSIRDYVSKSNQERVYSDKQRVAVAESNKLRDRGKMIQSLDESASSKGHIIKNVSMKSAILSSRFIVPAIIKRNLLKLEITFVTSVV